MRLERLTEKAQDALPAAAREAQERGQQAIEFDHLLVELAERNIHLRVTELANELLAERGWDPVYGARPLKGTVQRLLQDKLALLILDGRFQEGDQVVVDAENGELVFNKEAPVEETAARAGASGAR